MFEWFKEIFPVEAFGPLVGGLLVWFGLNFVFLAPSVIAPRLAERYYAPACVAMVETGRAAFIKTAQEEEAAYKGRLNDWIREQTANSQSQVGSVLGQIFGAYGQQGQDFMNHYGSELGDFSNRVGGQVMGPLQLQAQEALTEYQGKKQAEIAAMRAAQKYSDAAGFCGCNITAALSNNVEMALYTSTLRGFKPKGIADLENGRVFDDECGKAPVA